MAAPWLLFFQARPLAHHLSSWLLRVFSHFGFTSGRKDMVTGTALTTCPLRTSASPALVDLQRYRSFLETVRTKTLRMQRWTYLIVIQRQGGTDEPQVPRMRLKALFMKLLSFIACSGFCWLAFMS